jgi:hypothetical protein
MRRRSRPPFTPSTLPAPKNPPTEFFTRWQRRLAEERDEEIERQTLQQQTHSDSNGHADVFIVDQADAASDDAHTMLDESNEDMVPASDDEREEEMKQLGQRIAEAARRHG